MGPNSLTAVMLAVIQNVVNFIEPQTDRGQIPTLFSLLLLFNPIDKHFGFWLWVGILTE